MRSTTLAKTANNDWRDVGRPSSCNASQLPPFLVTTTTTTTTTKLFISLMCMNEIVHRLGILGSLNFPPFWLYQQAVEERARQSTDVYSDGDVTVRLCLRRSLYVSLQRRSVRCCIINPSTDLLPLRSIDPSHVRRRLLLSVFIGGMLDCAVDRLTSFPVA